MSITKTVQRYIDTHPSVKDCIQRGIVNYSALARTILRESSLSQENVDAALIAARRYARRLHKEKHSEQVIISILRNSTLQVRNKIAVSIVSKDALPLVRQLQKKRDIPYVIEGSAALTLVAANDVLADSKKLFARQLISHAGNLALVTIASPLALETTPGVMAALTAALRDSNVNIIELMSCYTDTLFVIEEQDVQTAMTALHY